MEEDDFSLCVLDNARKAARAVSRHYDRLARQVGVTPGQFSILVAIRKTSPESTGVLADHLSMERTTLVRNVALLERKGLVIADLGADGRGKHFSLSADGARLLERALPLWRQGQREVLGHLGGEKEFMKAISALQQLSKL